jgi:hypothetical protein
MNASVISALAALAGAAVGGLTSVLATGFIQKTQARAQWTEQGHRAMPTIEDKSVDTIAENGGGKQTPKSLLTRICVIEIKSFSLPCFTR